MSTVGGICSTFIVDTVAGSGITMLLSRFQGDCPTASLAVWSRDEGCCQRWKHCQPGIAIRAGTRPWPRLSFGSRRRCRGCGRQSLRESAAKGISRRGIRFRGAKTSGHGGRAFVLGMPTRVRSGSTRFNRWSDQGFSVARLPESELQVAQDQDSILEVTIMG